MKKTKPKFCFPKKVFFNFTLSISLIVHPYISLKEIHLKISFEYQLFVWEIFI